MHRITAHTTRLPSVTTTIVGQDAYQFVQSEEQEPQSCWAFEEISNGRWAAAAPHTLPLLSFVSWRRIREPWSGGYQAEWRESRKAHRFVTVVSPHPHCSRFPSLLTTNQAGWANTWWWCFKLVQTFFPLVFTNLTRSLLPPQNGRSGGVPTSCGTYELQGKSGGTRKAELMEVLFFRGLGRLTIFYLFLLRRSWRRTMGVKCDPAQCTKFCEEKASQVALIW